MSKERLEEIDFDEVWKPVEKVIEYQRMDYEEAVTIGGQFGVLKKEIERLEKQNNLYLEALVSVYNKDCDYMDIVSKALGMNN